MNAFRLVAAGLFALGLTLSPAAPVLAAGPDPLPSWNAGPRKEAILDFVQRVTEPGGKDFVAVDDRIAVFDNDGTLTRERLGSLMTGGPAEAVA